MQILLLNVNVRCGDFERVMGGSEWVEVTRLAVILGHFVHHFAVQTFSTRICTFVLLLWKRIRYRAIAAMAYQHNRLGQGDEASPVECQAQPVLFPCSDETHFFRPI